MEFGEKLFCPPYSEKICKVLPTLFNMVELENKRGNKLGMEAGTARERVLIALFMYVYGDKSISFPASTSPELDVWVNDVPISIKTKSTGGYAGVKLVWTVDWVKIDEFVQTYHPSSHLLYINILWGKTGKFCLITKGAQIEVLDRLTIDSYVKIPAKGTNPRGIELSKEAMQQIQNHPTTQILQINWKRDPSLLVERALYGRWIQLWDSL